MKISMIVALGKNQGIGLKKDLPWKLPADLKRFKELTLGHHLIMGRRTFESIGRPLPHRDSIVITQNAQYSFPERGVFVVSSLQEGLDLAAKRAETEVFICGGGQVYEEALPLADTLYLTEVDYTGEVDTFFPEYLHLGWEIVKEEKIPATEKDPYATTFKILNRIVPPPPPV